MSITVTLLEERDSKGRNLWRLEHDFFYTIGPYLEIKVPQGYVTNFGTIPRIFYRFVTPAEMREAALVHDYMCSEDFVDDGHTIQSGYTRWMADAVLYQHLRQIGIGPIRSWMIYKAVRSYAVMKGLK